MPLTSRGMTWMGSFNKPILKRRGKSKVRSPKLELCHFYFVLCPDDFVLYLLLHHDELGRVISAPGPHRHEMYNGSQASGLMATSLLADSDPRPVALPCKPAIAVYTQTSPSLTLT
jgi:hypothetical protein